MASDIKGKKTTDKSKKITLVVLAAILAIAVIVGIAFLIYNSAGVQYNIAVDMIEKGNTKEGYEILMDVAKKNADYKDTKELLYSKAVELIGIGDMENKKSAYDMLMCTWGYKYTDELIYLLWAEEVYDPKEDGTFEQADQFIQMLPENYDGPFAEQVSQLREDISASMTELNRKKYEAAMSDDEEIFLEADDRAE